jgi:hypothetical protein
MFDLPNVIIKPGATLDDYLLKRTEGIYKAWAADRPCYLDAFSVPVDWRAASGEICVAFVTKRLRALGARVLPVTGTVTDRGVNYVKELYGLSQPDGVCLRIGRDEFAEPKLLSESIRETLGVLGLGCSQVDVVVDYRYVGNGDLEHLRAAALDALTLLSGFGSFRNVMVAASSIPALLPKRDEGKVRREPRRDFELWAALFPLRPAGLAMPLCDYGIVGAHYVPPGKPVNTPARVRYTTPTEHIFLRGKRDEHSKACRQLLQLNDFSGSEYSVGDQRLSQSAAGRLGKGTAAMWVGYDANHHVELVSEQAWQVIKTAGLASLFSLDDAKPRPWLQPELLQL